MAAGRHDSCLQLIDFQLLVLLDDLLCGWEFCVHKSHSGKVSPFTWGAAQESKSRLLNRLQMNKKCSEFLVSSLMLASDFFFGSVYSSIVGGCKNTVCCYDTRGSITQGTMRQVVKQSVCNQAPSAHACTCEAIKPGHSLETTLDDPQFDIQCRCPQIAVVCTSMLKVGLTDTPKRHVAGSRTARASRSPTLAQDVCQNSVFSLWLTRGWTEITRNGPFFVCHIYLPSTDGLLDAF